MKTPAPSPIIPSDTTDRTGTAGIMRRAMAEIRRRFVGLKRDVVRLFDAIPILAGNDAATAIVRTIYQMTPEQLARLSADLQATLERWISNGRDPAHVFWFATYDAEAQQLGTAQSVANLSKIAPAYAATRTLQDVVYSEAYRTRLAAAQLRSLEHWTSLSAGMRSELSSIIGRAVIDGKNPRVVRREIAERLGVSMSRAAQYAQTEITGALRDARAAEADQAKEDYGLDIALLWTSALIPTTRHWHASRNGKTYSTQEVRAFYAEGGNKYNCHCAQTEVILDDDGRPMLSKKAQSALANEKAAWFSRYGGK